MSAQNKYKVLIAEDDYLVAEEIKRALKIIGFEIVGEAVDGAEAIDMVEKFKPDVVLMDIHMPVLDGLEASKIIYEKSATPIVVLTAHESSELVEKAGRNGVGAYLTKPPKPGEIEKAITIAIARNKDIKELTKLNNELLHEIKIRKSIEKRLKATLDENNLLLQEKEMLNKEIHHRVKNNFMVVSSLLELQSKTIKNQEIKNVFKESQARIQSMALVHEKLYQSKNLTDFGIREYMINLIQSLLNIYKADLQKINIDMYIDDIHLPTDLAVPCGLVINELVSNAFKYAFGEEQKGTIEIKFEKTDDKQISLSVADNGKGLPKEFDMNNLNTLGMKLVSQLAIQLEGELTVESENGAKFTIVFPGKHNKF